jgi:hypothetical protein
MCTFCIMIRRVKYDGKRKSVEKSMTKCLKSSYLYTKPTWSIQIQTEYSLNKYRKVEPVFVAKNSDEIWIGVKG